MILELNKKQCCGCMACASACPQNAIECKEDEKGFIYPQINIDRCVSCGICNQVCDFKRKKEEKSTIKYAYAFQIANKSELKNSTSGGVFTAVSDVILSEGGYIAGAVMEEDFTVSHMITNTCFDRDRMRLSKYVQSNTNNIFEKIQKLLNDKKKVLFVGTPCQVAGLQSYLQRTYDNLIICDFLCHGVPNQKLFNSHIAWLENEYGEKVSGYSFRNKKYGWNHGIDEVVFINGKKKDGRKIQAFVSFFQKGVSLRPSCYNCKYRSRYRYSDITIADFWGIEKILNIKSTKGYSLIIVNTIKGQKMVDKIAESNLCRKVDVNSILYRVSTKPSDKSNETAFFWESIESEGYGTTVEKYFDFSFRKKIVFEIKKVVLKIKKVICEH